MKKELIILSFVFFFFSQFVSFVCSQQEQKEIELGEIVVTATKTEKQIREVPQTTFIITKDEIERPHIKHLGDVLRRVAGIDVRSVGALGALNTLTLRGLSDKQVLFLLDGIPIQEVQGGGLDLSMISLNNIERIEILKGPASSLYGANALGGVVNIITKEPDKLLDFKISLGKYKKYSGLYGGRLKKLNYLISKEVQSSDGIRENSDYKGKSLDLKLTYQGDDIYILNYKIYDGEKGTPGSLRTPSKVARQWDKNEYFHLISKGKLENWGEMIVRSYYNTTERKYFDGRKTSIHKNTIDGVEMQDIIKINEENVIITGYESQRLKNDSTETGKNELKNRAYYLQIENKSIKNTIINLGFRHDKHKTYGKKDSPRLSLVYNKGENIIHRVVFGEAFRAPTFNDLYWPKTPWAEGNPKLKPEKGSSIELATEYRENDLKLLFAIFQTDVKNLINWAQYPDGKWRPSNIDEARMTGCEIALSNKITKNLFSDFNLTMIDAMDKKLNRKLTYSPDLKFNWKLKYLNKGMDIAIENHYTDRRIYRWRAGKPEYLPSHQIYNVTALLKFKNLNISLSCQNIFNKKYQEVYDYPMPGRLWSFEIHNKF